MNETDIRLIIREELRLNDLITKRDKLIRKKYQHLSDATNTEQRFGKDSGLMHLVLFDQTEKEIDKLDEKIKRMDLL